MNCCSVSGMPLYARVGKLIFLYVKLKGWRLLASVLMIISLVSNNFFRLDYNRSDGIDHSKTFLYIGADQFVHDNVLLLNSPADELDPITTEMINLANVTFPSDWYEACSSTYECGVRHVVLMLTEQSKNFGLIDYRNHTSNSKLPNVVCQFALGSELYCPLLSYYAYGSVFRNTLDPVKTFEVFRLMDRVPDDGVVYKTNDRPVCSTSAIFGVVFPQILTLQSLLVVGSFYFYFLVACAACVCDLKSHGFLQLLVQRGLSVRAYWIALWLVTVVEAVLFSAISVSSYTLQCREYYRSDRIFQTFIMTAMQFLGASSLCFMYTVVLESHSHVSVAIVTTAFVTMLIILLNRLILSTHLWAQMLTAIVPFTNHANFQECALLEGVSPKSDFKLHHHVVFIACGLFPAIVVALTLYLDQVLRTGNGKRLPFNLFKKRRSGLRSPEAIDMTTLTKQRQEPNVLVESDNADGLTPVVHSINLSKTFTISESDRACCNKKLEKRALKSVSVTTYKGQITAILGSNGAGKSSLLNILGGQSRMDEGNVFVAGHSLCQPNSSGLLRGRVGVFLQEGALCQRLTVLETLRLLALSTGCYWRDFDDEVLRLMSQLRLTAVLRKLVSDLSWSQRRVLCTAMALLGPADLIILDEPITGLDATLRECLWRVLRKRRYRRSIVLSTQQVDEAAVFAEWMILLSKGSVRCTGSPDFFSTICNCGMMMRASVFKDEHIDLLLKALTTKYQEIQLHSHIDRTLEFHLPLSFTQNAEALSILLEHYRQFVSSFSLTHRNLKSAWFKRQLGTDESVKEPGRQSSSESMLKPGSNVVVTTPMNAQRPLKKRNGETLDTRLKTDSQGGSTCRMISAVLTINFRRTLRHKSKLCFDIIVFVVQLTSILGGIVAESSLRTHSDYNRVSLLADLATVGRGVCVGDLTSALLQDPHLSVSECEQFFKQQGKSPPERFMVQYKPGEMDLQEWLQNGLIQATIKNHCTAPMEPCPIIYMRKWGPRVEIPLHLGVGVYVKRGEYSPRTTASATVSLFIRTLEYMGNSSDLEVQGIFDIRATLLPLFGVYFQIVLISTMPANFLSDLVEDATKKVRNQLRIFGMRNSTYWFMTCLVHWLQYSFAYLCSWLVLAIVMPDVYASLYMVKWVLLPTLFLGLLSNQLLAYNIGARMCRAGPAVPVGYLLYSLTLCLLVHVVQLHSPLGEVMFFIVPQFASIALTFHGAKNSFLARAYFQNSNANAAAVLPQLSVVLAIAAMAAQLLLLLISLICRENPACLTLCAKSTDENAEEENRKRPHCLVNDKELSTQTFRIVHNPQGRSHILEARMLTKEYPGSGMAVRCVTFGVKPGEVFGLVGPNDSGKSTIARLLTGQDMPTSGSCDVVVGQEWLTPDQATGQRGIGYCPQYNALYDCITVREHLWFYSAVLGLSERRAQADADKLIERLGLKPHEDKPAADLSSGFRRRLSIAVALLGDPTVAILDDISRGMDTRGKAFVREAIRSTVGKNRSVLVTTISLEDAQDLCDRVGILCEGYLLSVGTVDHISDTYGNAFKLELLFPAAADKKLKDSAVRETLTHFREALLVRRLRRRQTFHVPSASMMPLSATYHWLDQMKLKLSFEQFRLQLLSPDEAVDKLLKQKDQLIVQDDMQKVSVKSDSDSF